MKKVVFLIMYLLSFFLTSLVGSAAFTGIRQGANAGSVAILAVLALVFLVATILFYKLYKKAKGGNR